jgi:putative acetyltransferase
MNSSSIEIRAASNADRDGILAVHLDAFGSDDGEVLAKLVAEMLGDPTAEPIHSLLAERGNEIVGHVLFTAVRIEPNAGTVAQILAPLAVKENFRGNGIGTQLVQEAFVALQSKGIELVFVLGYPDYYSRFGFTPAGVRGFEAPYPILPKNAASWMVKALSPKAIENNQGTVRCCNALDHSKYWEE